jgi:HSP90 family molecular chaperone
MSNCSDALEKQRYNEIAGKSSGQGDPEGLYINILTNEKERTITIFDSGVGMTRKEASDNLGTIAKSGSKEFLENVSSNKSAD